MILVNWCHKGERNSVGAALKLRDYRPLDADALRICPPLYCQRGCEPTAPPRHHTSLTTSRNYVDALRNRTTWMYSLKVRNYLDGLRGYSTSRIYVDAQRLETT